MDAFDTTHHYPKRQVLRAILLCSLSQLHLLARIAHQSALVPGSHTPHRLLPMARTRLPVLVVALPVPGALAVKALNLVTPHASIGFGTRLSGTQNTLGLECYCFA